MREGAESPRLTNSTYSDVVFKRVDWTRKEFHEIRFVSCRFEDVLFTDVTFTNCVFERCQFDMATFKDVVFNGGLLQLTHFVRSELGGTEFKSKHATEHGVVDTEPMLARCAFEDVGLEDVKFKCHGIQVSFSEVTMQDTMIFRKGKFTPMSGTVDRLLLDFEPKVMGGLGPAGLGGGPRRRLRRRPE